VQRQQRAPVRRHGRQRPVSDARAVLQAQGAQARAAEQQAYQAVVGDMAAPRQRDGSQVGAPAGRKPSAGPPAPWSFRVPSALGFQPGLPGSLSLPLLPPHPTAPEFQNLHSEPRSPSPPRADGTKGMRFQEGRFLCLWSFRDLLPGGDHWIWLPAGHAGGEVSLGNVLGLGSRTQVSARLAGAVTASPGKAAWKRSGSTAASTRPRRGQPGELSLKAGRPLCVSPTSIWS
jgi:hypothetical protein